MKLNLIFLFIFLSTSILWAHKVPEFIIEDLAHEINEADFIALSAEQRKELIEKLKSDEKMNFPELKEFLVKAFGEDLFSYLKSDIEKSVLIPVRKTVNYVTAANISLNQQHSISNIKSYIQNRIGHGTYNKIITHSIKPVVIGGTEKKIEHYLGQILNPGKYQIVKIPSLYEAWGITKYYVPIQPGVNEPILLWIVPPALRYVRHNLTLFSSVAKNSAKGFVDISAENEYQEAARLNKLWLFTKSHGYDYLAFGYSQVWLKQIADRADLRVLNIENFNDLSLGITFKIIHIEDVNTKAQTKIGILSSNLTVWGELAAFHIKQLLHPNLKGVLFLGSAGSSTAEINPYDLSVPNAFLRPGRKINITNFLNEGHLTSSEISIHTHSRHGNTFSPIEQNRSYLRSVVRKNIQTMDVEQTLVAETVLQYNLKNKTSIKFGAANVVTDKPYSLLVNEEAHHNLDILDHKLKQKAREHAVSISLNKILHLENLKRINSCLLLFH